MRKRVTPKRQDDFLKEMTGRSSAWWFAFVQGRIRDRFVPNPKNKDHDNMANMGWLEDVVRMAVKTMPTEGTYDENMRAGLVSAYVLSMWYLRLHRAKTMDPNRPINIRQESYRTWLRSVSALMMLPVDQSEDAAYFVGQKWDDPFSPDAKDGKFV